MFSQFHYIKTNQTKPLCRQAAADEAALVAAEQENASPVEVEESAGLASEVEAESQVVDENASELPAE